VRKLIAPVIEITPAFSEKLSALPPKRIAQAVWRFALGSGGSRELYVDLGNLLEHPEADIICHEFEYLVLSLHADTQLVFHVSDFSKRGIRRAGELLRKNGAAFRVTSADYLSPALSDFITFMKRTALTPADIDLLVDCEMVAEGQKLRGTADRLEKGYNWRSITYIAGSFPASLSAFPKNNEYEVPRIEWQSFSREARSKANVRYGDYTIQHPLQRDPVPFPPSASIRYAGERYWVLMRGEKPGGPNAPGPEQYIGHAFMLRQRSEFCGADFSAGDAYIDFIAGQDVHTGNPTKWIQAGVNHHVTLAAHQLQRLRAA